jgi:hypothetical protein
MYKIQPVIEHIEKNKNYTNKNMALLHMIYVRWFGLFESFYERWNTYETAKIRLNELNNS